MDGSRAGARMVLEQAAADAGQLPRLTDEFLETLTLAAIACTRNDGHAEAIGIALWCYEKAGREPPDFGRFSNGECYSGHGNRLAANVRGPRF
jgi:hypothetical protein